MSDTFKFFHSSEEESAEINWLVLGRGEGVCFTGRLYFIIMYTMDSVMFLETS